MPELLIDFGEQPEGDYTVLMGATTYRVMSGFAEGGEPGTEALAGLSKIVFSTLCRSLLNAGLVDRFRVVVFPVITGSTGHDRIYDGYPDVALEMIRSRTFDARTQLLEYAPTVLSGPPSANTSVEQ